MPDEETATPNPAKTVKFAKPGQAGALFPQLQVQGTERPVD